MNPKNTISGGDRGAGAAERLFTVESANDALVFVRRVVRDAVETYRELMRLRSEQQELTLAADAGAELENHRRITEQTVERLKLLHQELVDVGCELKDFSEGLVDFPVRYDGRRVLLCWKLGEPEVAYWHEQHAGFAGRQPIDAQFRLRAAEPVPIETGVTPSR